MKRMSIGSDELLLAVIEQVVTNRLMKIKHMEHAKKKNYLLFIQFFVCETKPSL